MCFVRDFQQGEPRKELRLFTTRPKLEGLWLRMHFRDGDAMDGILSNNLLQLDTFGFSVVPPDPGFQNQRVFVPKAALSRIQVLGVVGSPRAQRRGKPKLTAKEQLEMFESLSRAWAITLSPPLRPSWRANLEVIFRPSIEALSPNVISTLPGRAPSSSL